MNSVFRLYSALLVAAVVLQAGENSACDVDKGWEQGPLIPRPIIAELFATPDKYIGRRVEIYGLILEVDRNGKRFALQDVSQMPISIVASENASIASGDQMIVSGVLRWADHDLEVIAHSIKPTRVVAGGGCC